MKNYVLSEYKHLIPEFKKKKTERAQKSFGKYFMFKEEVPLYSGALMLWTWVYKDFWLEI